MKAYTQHFLNKLHIIMNNKEILKKNLEYAKNNDSYLIMQILFGGCWLQ